MSFKKDCAVFTMCKNEKYFLSRWIKHYNKYFSFEDLYVLDHQSEDHSTKNLPVNVIPVINEYVYDEYWRKQIIEDFQRKLLKSYQCVIFCDTDEFLYSLHKPLNETIKDFLKKEDSYITCRGFNIFQDIEKEKTLSEDEDILSHRKHWYHTSYYDKTLISKIPLEWCIGFHSCNQPWNFSFNVYMAHLKYVDFDLLTSRAQEKVKEKEFKHKSGPVSAHCRILEKEQIISNFNKEKESSSASIAIPKEHREALKGL